MDTLTQFFRSFRTLAFAGALASMLPWPGLTRSAVAQQVPVGGETSLQASPPWAYWNPNPAFHALADVNGDGRADLIYTLSAGFNTSQTNVYVQYSNGSSFGAPVVVATDSSTVRYLCDPDNCAYSGQALINAVGDVNGDGRPDILFADGTVALGNGSGFGPKGAWGGETSLQASPPWTYWGPNPAFHALADVNGDGRADLIYTLSAGFNTSQTNVYVQYSNGSSFGAPVVVATDSSTVRYLCDPDNCAYSGQALINAVGDVNGDGRPDILFADGTVALGNGSGFGPKGAWGGETSLQASPPWTYWNPNPAFHALADVNGDGRADLIYTLSAGFNTSQTNVYVQYSNGSSFGAPVVVATDSSTVRYLCDPDNCAYSGQALINAVGDINGDRQTDILYANGSASTVLKPTSVIPKYLIGSVIYVPPGGSGQGSKITYSQGAVTGSTITTKDSWSASSTTSGGVSIFGNTADISFGATFSSSDSTSVDMVQTTQIIDPYSQQPPSDRINHDYDVIQVYFGVVVNGTRDYQGNISASLDFSQMLAQGFSVDGYFVQVGCFRPGSSIYTLNFCVDYRELFLDTAPDKPNKFQLTVDDLPNIVRADPYADPATAPSTPDAVPGRYVLLTNLPYSPNPNSPAMWPVTNSSTTTNTHMSTVTYTVGLKFTNVTDPTGLFTSKLTVDNKLTWSHESTSSNRIGTTSGSTLTLAAPNDAVAPTGVINIYMDTVYKRFMFWIPTN